MNKRKRCTGTCSLPVIHQLDRAMLTVAPAKSANKCSSQKVSNLATTGNIEDLLSVPPFQGKQYIQ